VVEVPHVWLEAARRMTFSHIEADGLDWEWATSRDGAFEPLWSLRYTRVAG
jgi:hypothetical protein